jgi:two-component system sensor kinase FixL
MTTRTSHARRKFSADGAKRPVAKNGAPIRLRRAPGIRNPKTELEAAIQRFVDLYDFAPIAYISFDRTGRIEEANLAATELLGQTRDLLIGRPFAFYVADLNLFLRHLLYCRTSEQQVNTELQLKPRKGELIPAQLISTPITSTTRNGALLYQTAIFDLSERKATEEKLAWLAAYPRDNPNPILEFDLETKAIHYANPSTHESFPDLQRLGLRHPFLVRVLDAAKPLLEGRTKSVHAEINIGKSCYAVTAVCIPKTRRLRVYSIDITERKQAEDRFRLAVEASPNGMIMVDQKGKITMVNAQTERLFGYTREELIGKSVDLLVPQRFSHRHAGYRAGFSAAPQARAMGAGRDLYGLRKDGSEVPIEIGLNPIQVSGQTLILSSIVDITARKKAEAVLQKSKELLEKRVRDRTHELHIANKELKDEITTREGLEEEILAISDREQQRLGQELHDGLCQHLTAVAFMARSVALRLKNHRVIDAADIEKIAQLVNDAATDTRNLSRALHRIDVDAAGFITALEDLVDREIWRVPCRLEVKPSFHVDDDMVAAQLYRIAREAVINANKHAQAREIVVRLERLRQGMALRVTDDGVGFRSESKLKHGLGVHIMNYRAQLIGGRLEIDSPKRDGGTCVSCYLPHEARESQRTKTPARAPAKSQKH